MAHWSSYEKIIIGLALGLVALIIVGLILASSYAGKLVKGGVEKFGPTLTKVEIHLEDVDLSPFSGGGSIKGLLVGNPEGYKAPTAIKVGSAKLALDPGSLLSEKVVIRTINVQAPEITFETDFKGNNLSKILANIEEATGGPSDSKEDTSGKKLQVDDFLISGAKMTVALTSLGGKSVTVPLPDIHLKDLGQGPEGITAGSLLKQVFAALEANAVKGASAAAKDLGTEAANAAKDAATGAADQVKEGIGGLFKK